jgi:DDE superfamily endonuclease
LRSRNAPGPPPTKITPLRMRRSGSSGACHHGGSARFLDVHRPWRKVKVTESRAAIDFAACMRELADVHFPKAERIRVVLDNLSTHSAGALYQAFPADQARRLLRRLEFHYVAKHASWLNMVEIEIGVLAANASIAASQASSN